MSFFDEFNHIVPYFVKVTVGKNKQFKTDPTKKSNLNHKGRMVAVYKKPKTLDELAKHGHGTYMEYVPAEQVSMPIDIQVTSDKQVFYSSDKLSKYTNRKITKHEIDIKNADKIHVGSVFIFLTPSGDIANKTSYYKSPDYTEEIEHQINNEMRDGILVKDEHFEFKRNSDTETKKVNISQRDGRVVGCSVLEQDLETSEDILFQSITEFLIDEETPKIKKYVASCVVDETDISKRGGLLIPWECQCLEADLLEYQRKQKEFQQYLDSVKQESGLSLSMDDVIELNKKSLRELKEYIGRGSAYTINYHAGIARYLKSEKNRLEGFKGEYIGNILKLTDKGYEACIVTKHSKEGKNYRLYTLIDLKGLRISEGGILGGYCERDKKYYERLENADKTPTFVTEIDEDGKETLVLHKGKKVSGECLQYAEFVQGFIAPFSEIKPVKISQFLNRENSR